MNRYRVLTITEYDFLENKTSDVRGSITHNRYNEADMTKAIIALRALNAEAAFRVCDMIREVVKNFEKEVAHLSIEEIIQRYG